MDWAGRLPLTLDLKQDCYVHYRIVKEGTCRDGANDIVHQAYGSPASVNVPHPDYTTYHNAEYPWYDNSAILFNFQLDKHWFIPNAYTRGAGDAEYYFHILAEDNYNPAPDPSPIHKKHGTKFCSPMITHHVCGINSSDLRKHTVRVFPTDRTFCSVDYNDYTT